VERWSGKKGQYLLPVISWHFVSALSNSLAHTPTVADRSRGHADINYKVVSVHDASKKHSTPVRHSTQLLYNAIYMFVL